MPSYRIDGARREDGAQVNEVLVAESEPDAVARANALGVLVSSAVRVEAQPAMYSQKRRRRIRRQQRERLLIRLIARIGAVILMVPGALVFLVSLISAIANLFDALQVGGTQLVIESLLYNAAGVFGATAIAAVMMTGGALIFLVLFIEESLYSIDRKA